MTNKKGNRKYTAWLWNVCVPVLIILVLLIYYIFCFIVASGNVPSLGGNFHTGVGRESRAATLQNGERSCTVYAIHLALIYPLWQSESIDTTIQKFGKVFFSFQCRPKQHLFD